MKHEEPSFIGNVYFRLRCRIMCMTSSWLPLVFIIVPLPSDAKAVLSSNQMEIGSTPEIITNGLSYLGRYGYLPSSDGETGFLRTIDELRSAIQQFQRFAGLPETGRFDDGTFAKFHQRRCGNADILDPINARENRAPSSASSSAAEVDPQNYVIGPSKWQKKAITFRILSFTPDLDYQRTRDAFIRALYVWSDVTQLTFHEVQQGEADILIQFTSGYHQDGYPFDGPGAVLAHAFFPGDDRGGDIHFDDDEMWTVRTEDGTNLFAVASHELGHSLGLSHSNVPGSLMYPWYQGYTTDFDLHPDDISAIQHLYGFKDFTMPTRPTTTRASTRASFPPDSENSSTTPGKPRVRVLGGTVPKADPPPDSCETNLEAIAVIRGEIFAFKGKWFWRIDRQLKIMDGYPIEMSRFWLGLPSSIQSVDAVYENPDGKTIFFFKGNRYWELSGTTLVPGFPLEGRALTALGLPAEVDHIDAAFVWGYNGRIYLVSGYAYWKMESDGRTVVQHDYPRDMSLWAGVPIPLDDAVTMPFPDGKTYFFQGNRYWEFNDALMRIRDDNVYPKTINERWLNCSTPRPIDRPTGSGSPATADDRRRYMTHSHGQQSHANAIRTVTYCCILLCIELLTTIL